MVRTGVGGIRGSPLPVVDDSMLGLSCSGWMMVGLKGMTPVFANAILMFSVVKARICAGAYMLRKLDLPTDCPVEASNFNISSENALFRTLKTTTSKP